MKRLAYIFIPILAILLMSHNANATSLVIPLTEYEQVNTSFTGLYDYYFSDGSSCVGTYSCAWPKGTSLRQASTHDTFNLKKGDIYTYYLYIYDNSGLQVTSNFSATALTPGYRHKVIGFNLVSNDSIDWQFITNGTSGEQGSITGKVYEIIIEVTGDTTSAMGSFNRNTNDFYYQGYYNNLTVAVSNFQLYRYVGSVENKEQAEATQDAADEASSSGSSSEASAEVATSSLISVIGGFVSVVTSATPTNCQINAYTDHLDMGNIDLCANPVPSYIQIIGSIILICAVIPLAIILFNRFIGLFRSFQG